MVKQNQQSKVNTTRGAELLIEYKQQLEAQVLELRAKACVLAAKVREIEKLIPAEQVQDIVDQHDADASWSFNNGLLDVLQEGKKAAGSK